MRILTALLLLCTALLCAAAFAETSAFRWTVGYAQGTIEAIIRNEFGSSVNLYCPSGQEDPTPGMFIKVDKIRPRAGERITVQIVVDDENHAFDLAEIQFIASGRANLLSFQRLVDDLAASKGRTFAVEFPKFGMGERFSLLGASKAAKAARCDD